MWKTAGSIAVLLLVLHALPARAEEGVIEINQARASAGGVTADDTPGFPVTISQSGSYRLTGNLTTSSRSATLISITANFVTLDLGGFSLVYCASLVLCPPGAGVGISAGPGVHDITVRNGNVHNSGDRCISLEGARARVENVRATSCGDTGIVVGVRSVVDQVIVEGASGNGLVIDEQGHVMRSSMIENGNRGIVANEGSLIESTVINGNPNGALSYFSSSSAEPVGYRGCVLQRNGPDEVQIPANAQPTYRSLGGNLCGADTVCP